MIAAAAMCRRTVALSPRDTGPCLLARFCGTPILPVASTTYQFPSIS